ncbi:MAG: hypothetical protein HQL25_08800 [Candidatus Omnitrophica bacterium]|nr:hypothetical protein [Candidatus Omnitrophota bacterium]
MQIKDILAPLLKLTIAENRGVEEDYAEIVFLRKDVQLWEKTLKPFLGDPVKPEGQKPTENDLQLTEEFGGIWSNQTLFYKDCGDVKLIGMFWPWQDERHVTFKLVCA